VKAGGGQDIHYQTARVALIHDFAGNFRTELEYVGNDRQSWLQLLMQWIPLSLILANGIPSGEEIGKAPVRAEKPENC
jgi:hypothetical protein